MSASDPANRQETETLLRAAVLFKFGGMEEAEPFVGSPVYAQALRRLLEAVTGSTAEVGDTRHAEGWRSTYRLSRHHDRWDFVAAYAARHPQWAVMGPEERRAWIDVVASPYWLEDEEYGAMGEAVDERTAT